MHSKTFRDFSLRPESQQALDEAGYTTPTPIQEQAIPILLRGHDLVGIAQTGTGKTLAYLLTIFQGLQDGGEGPQAVVMCPTRELAIQVAGEAERFGKHLGLRTVLAYGGTSSGMQKQALSDGCDLLVATPGRLLDFLQQATLSLRRVRVFVLDEADRMLDMGFIRDIDAILKRAPMSRQTLLFSATFPEEIRRLSERYMFHPETVRIEAQQIVKDTIDHSLIFVDKASKDAALVALLQRENPAKALVFTATREATSEISRRLRARNMEVVALSSLLSQANRERALDAFRRGEFHILVATDVAARGLDITDIDLVINYDVPMHAEDYVHRIGRTGRAHRLGRAITFVTPLDARRLTAIEHLLGEPVRPEPLAGFSGERAEGGGGGGAGRRRRPRTRGRRTSGARRG
ncbi:MAG TPA: DEAD/DEAH box helicase [Candidatus Polarisedimenticolaceae bacterium]